MNDYQQQAMRTVNRNLHHDMRLAGLALGLAGEAGEVADIIKKELTHGHEPSPDAVAKELGDVLWYLANIATDYGYKLQDIADMNIAKLKARYPQGFDEEKSRNR